MTTAVLVHGMGRTRASMWPLARALRREGVRVDNFGYTAARERVDAIVVRLAARLAQHAASPCFVVGHSLGGLLLRAAIARLPDGTRRPFRLVMVGTPARAPRLARQFEHQWWYRLINGDAGALLADEARMSAIPSPAVPCTTIAGTRGPVGAWSPFGGDVNDGIVAVNEVRAPECGDWSTVRALHPFLMRDAGVHRLIAERCLGGTRGRIA